jgi:hypothetical protein
MSDRPADSIEKLADYLWWLLPEFLKKKDRATSLVGGLCDAVGGVLDTSRSLLEAVVPELVVATASGEYLDQLARARQIFRGVDEDDESLRTRVLGAYAIKVKGGTIPGMIAGLDTIGYTVEVDEPNKGTDHWSRFLVTVLLWDGVVEDQAVFYQVVRLLKPAHTRALIESLLPPATWDDWELLDPPEELDEGYLDEWLPTG